MGRLGKAFKNKRKPGAAAEDEDGEGSGSDHEQQQAQQPKPKQPPPSPPKAAAAAAPPPPPAANSDDDDDDDEDNEGHHNGPETRGHMVQRHKRELMALKKQRGKGKAEAAKALADLEARHATELAELEARGKQAPAPSAAAAAAAPSSPSAAGDRASKYLAGVSLGDEAAAKSNKGPTKAQKRRDKLAQREQERDARIAAELAALGPTQRAEEAAALRALLKPLGLAVKSIRPDGHCLYHSVADQLEQHPNGEEEAADAEKRDYLSLRRLAAEHMRLHRPDFEPFVSAAEASGRVPHGAKGEEDEEDDDNADPFEAYVSAVEKTAAWGGHVELTALAGALKRRIRVVAVGMPEVVAGEEFEGKDKELTVCYVRHEFGLGEHYNSVRPRVEGEEEEEEGEEEGGAAAAEVAAAGSSGDDE